MGYYNMPMFTHLHVHTEYSLLDGVNRIPTLVARIKELGMKSCAITDHGSMYGVFKFYSEMKANELKPILGVEMYLAPRNMKDKIIGIDNKYTHITVLAQNLTGYKNLMKLVSISHFEGFYFKPRIDWKLLEEYNEGLILLSGCFAGILTTPIRNGNMKEAKENARKLLKIFGDRLYIEIQRSNIEGEEDINKGLIEISKELNIPIVATCDSHYLNKEDAKIQEILWAISDGKTLEDPTRRVASSDEFYVKTQEEMEDLFKDIPEAIENTQKIVDKIEDFTISYGRVEPIYKDLPKGVTAKQHLHDIVYEKAKEKYKKITKEIKDRIDYELQIIDDKGYNNYFLVVYDFILFCKREGIMANARGSGVGVVTAYCLDIASVDPIKWGLYFERFLNPGRNSPPDFDIDLSDTRRMEVIRYAQEKYNPENVRQIVTFSKLQTRQAIRDISRVMGIDLATADKLSKLVKVEFGKTKPIDYMMETNPEFSDLVRSSDKLKEMTEVVKKVAGIARGVSMHACGVVITPNPIDEYAPTQPDSKNENVGMVQFEMNDLEYLGLLKFDFLGLRNLSIIDNALRKIKRATGKLLDLKSIDDTDPEVYKDLQEGHTVGVFQLEGEGMIKALQQIRPISTEDICYLLAAYRPGPIQFIPEYVAVKQGRKKPEYIFPELEPILGVTNGVISYQEQVMRIATDIAGYTLSEADNMRRAMGKKKMEIMTEEAEKFIQGGMKKGFQEKGLREIADLLLKFANYGFNKSHGAAYAMISYYTAYLKHYYPLEYMASLLEADLGRFDDMIKDINECERLGIKVLPPSINKSGLYFAPGENKEEKYILFGMGSIKNVGTDIVRTIVEERKENGNYLSLDDFIFRLSGKKIQLRTVEYLIQAGAFDEFGEREALLAVLPGIIDRAKKYSEITAQGQIDLFSNGDTSSSTVFPATTLDSSKKTAVFQKLQWEKELLGFYFSSHPLDNLKEFFASKNVINISDLKGKRNGSLVVLGVLISRVKRITTKNKDRMAFLTLEDKSGAIDCLVFPRVYDEVKDTFQPNTPLLLAGRISLRDDQMAIIYEKAQYIDQNKFSSDFSGVIFKITKKHKQKEIASLKEYIKNNPGETPVKIILCNEKEPRTIDLRNGIILNDESKELLKRFS